MQEDLDYLDETIPKQSDDALLNILAVNAAAYSPLAIEFTIEELETRGFEIKQAEHGFEVITPTGSELNFPRKAETLGGANESYTYPGGAGRAREEELAGVGGWLGLLILDLAIFSPLFFLVMVYALGFGINIISYYPQLGWLIVVDRVSGMAIAGLSIYAGVKLYRVRPGAVRFTKRFLLISGVYATLVSGLIYLAATNTGVAAIKENVGTIPAFIVSAWVGRGVWYLYLSYSKRVAATYGPKNDQGA
jgi:hypothetical protein